MQFTVLPARTRPPVPSPRQVFLIKDDWDDYTFKTTFLLLYSDGTEIHQVGQVKIGRFGMRERERTTLADHFRSVDEGFFSLGQDDTYYEKLRDLGDDVRLAVLVSLRDVAYDQELFARACEEEVTRTSLLRSVSGETVVHQFHRIARGGARLTPFDFSYTAPGFEGVDPLTLSFTVKPGASPPTNVHALIGSNGVGKTRLLSYLARAVADGSVAVEDVGHVTNLTGTGPVFTNMVSVASSAFDLFTPVQETNGTHHAHVTLARGSIHSYDVTPAQRFAQLVAGLTGARLARWQTALSTLAEADPLLRDADVLAISRLAPEHSPADSEEAFDRLSSGHKIVLLAVTNLADLVTETTLVLIDEPETHLHPPLLAAFIRAVSDLLADRNGVAVIATHSPVVLQETPRKCVWVLRRSGQVVRAMRPAIETFGENVGILTHEAFGLEVTRSGFHRDLEQAVNEGLAYHEVVERFGGELGSEAKSLVRVLISVRDRRERLF
ncbi:AAA family ATPase [Streptomyces sp. HNM0663]|uniref:AAA family ATPase n=1 Tax=Streptomyces chengmaiensis TaxID=3040919 RepID=A0ABT6HI20_9ACTN|nr:AAA family ATPase [Streptomyces chengmaiensis]MDH2387684.1 AAA family ATPase [Streptomyces chengmaiensis]